MNGTWVEVDLDAIAHNLAAARGLVGDGVEVMAVVKANAYGHGAVEVARHALCSGATRLGVSSVAEADELRRAGIRAPILVFSPPLPAEMDRVVELGLTATVSSAETAGQLERAAACGRPVKVHVKVDSGLNRFGLPPQDAAGFLRALAGSPLLEVEGIYTQFPHRNRRLQAQFRAFNGLLGRLQDEGLRPPIAHAANSTVLAEVPEAHLDMVRVGNLLYGFAPASARLDLRKTMYLRSSVVRVRRVKRGEPVGYEGDFVAPRDMTVAVLPIGFADGFMVDVVRPVSRWGDVPARLALEGRRSLRALLRGHGVTIRGRAVNLVGRVGMQHCCVDVTSLPDVEAGETATIATRYALTSPRLPRVYLRAGQPVPATAAAEIAATE